MPLAAPFETDDHKMCGFIAVVALHGQPAPIEPLQRGLESIAHRGPDDEGTEFDGPVGLGFRRLSILDLSEAGHQPMRSSDGRYTIVFNGEIYNFVELRAELQALGHRFRSTGDTEVLLTAYRQWGSACLDRLNGMWAFVIHDRVRGVVFGSRDRFGMKPLFRWRDRQQMVFASEIKAIRATGLYRGSMNPRVCAAFLFEHRLDESPESFFEGIESVQPGHSFELQLDGRYAETPYWQLDEVQETRRPDAPEAFAALFEDAMRIHMRSDVPVGVNLSGGLDSTSILCAAARLRAHAGADTPLLAFCYHDAKFDEQRYVRDTLAQTGARMVPLELSPQQLWDSFPKVLAAQDEPVHAMSALIGYHLMHLARSHGVKVVLNGQGADEVLAGYGNYFDRHWVDQVRHGNLSGAWSDIRDFSAGHGGSAAGRMRAAVSEALQAPLRRATLAQRRAGARQRQIDAARRCAWLQPGLAEELPVARLRSPDDVELRPTLLRSVRLAPLPLYLRVEDRNAMAHSVEGRLPFLDPRLVRFAFSLPSHWKTHGRWNKYVLREGMRGRIPESVRNRVDKMGFSTSSHDWIRNELRDTFRGLVADAGRQHKDYFDAAGLQKLLDAHVSGVSTHTGALLAVAQFHLWQQQHTS